MERGGDDMNFFFFYWRWCSSLEIFKEIIFWCENIFQSYNYLNSLSLCWVYFYNVSLMLVKISSEWCVEVCIKEIDRRNEFLSEW